MYGTGVYRSCLKMSEFQSRVTCKSQRILFWRRREYIHVGSDAASLLYPLQNNTLRALQATLHRSNSKIGHLF